MPTSSSSTSTTPAAPPPHPSSALLPGPPSAANSLPDELLDKILAKLVSADTQQHPLYSVCLASRRFRRVAQPLLWEVVAFEVDNKDGGAAFVDMAQQFGHYTRGLYLVFSKKADDEAYSAYTPALEFTPGARSVQVVQDAESELERFEPIDLFANTELSSAFPFLALASLETSSSCRARADLEHLGILHLPRTTGLPRISFLRSIRSLDLAGSGLNAILGRLYETPGLMPSLRALAADTWWIPRAGDSDYLFAQLDMFQVHASPGWLANSPRDKVPLLADSTLSAGDRPRTTMFDPAMIGSPVGDAEVDAAWSRLCAAARAMCLPGRLVGDSEGASVLPGGQLDFGFWQYAKRLRAAGEV